MRPRRTVSVAMVALGHEVQSEREEGMRTRKWARGFGAMCGDAWRRTGRWGRRQPGRRWLGRVCTRGEHALCLLAWGGRRQEGGGGLGRLLSWARWVGCSRELSLSFYFLFSIFCNWFDLAKMPNHFVKCSKYLWHLGNYFPRPSNAFKIIWTFKSIYRI